LPDQLARPGLRALSFLRQRMAPRLGSAGLRVTRSTEIPDDGPTGVTPDQILHLVRIAREAISNVLKHGDPTQVGVSLHNEPAPGGDQRLDLEVADKVAAYHPTSPKHGASRLCVGSAGSSAWRPDRQAPFSGFC
jgi:two-component sensor histidine kinase